MHAQRIRQLERRRSAGRVLVAYEDGPCWIDGRIVPDEAITASDTVVKIVYKAPADAVNVKRLVWGDDDNDNPMHDAAEQ